MRIRKAINAFAKVLSEAGLNKPRVRVVLMLSFGIYLVFAIALGYAWYSHQFVSMFHFFDDAAEWKQMDKFAHFFWTFQACALAARLLAWAQLDAKPAAITGAIMGFVFVSSIEVGDGFSDQYGASVFDILANTAGCVSFVAQRFIWKKINIWPKFSFHPTMFAPLRPALLGNGLLEEILKDYNGQTFWYSFQIGRLPFPRWLTLAVGVGAEGMVYGRDAQNELMNFSPYRKYFLSVDINLSHVKTSSKVLNSCLYLFNIIKFPAPAIEFSTQGVRFHAIYF